ncbi:MAG: xanthine dehydrogenase family protein molybdopterin-binding subunit [Actinomycetota bacterium]
MWVGRRLRRLEDPALLRGEGHFVADGATHSAAMRFVRSPVAHGTILGIEKPDGAVVITGDDIAEIPPIVALLHRDDFKPVPQPILPRERVVFAGQAVAAVIADTAAEAEDVAEQVFVDIDPLPPVIGFERALEDGAPLVHESVPGNLIIDSRFETPSFSETFKQAAHHVTVDIRSHRQSAMPIETRGGHAEFDPFSGRVTLVASTQGPHMDRTAIVEVLGIPAADLHVVAPDVGGAFGQKYSLAIEDILAVWAARRLRRSVAWVEDRRENFTSSFHGRDHRYILTGAFDRDGRLAALKADIVCDVGAFSCYPVTCGVEALMALAEMPGPYAIEEYRSRSRAVATNTCPIAPYRGVSRPVITLALERLMDTAGREIGIDPLELRRRNLITDFPYRSATGLVYDSGSYVESLDKAVEVVDLDGFRARQREALDEGRRLGIGFSTFSERTGYGSPAFAARNMDVTLGFETVHMRMEPSGDIEVRIGASPHGQGLRTSLSQLIADELGLEPQRIHVVHGDTERTPFGWGTFASRSMVLSGGASKLAAQDLRARLADMAAGELEVSPDDIEFVGGDAKVRGTGLSIDLKSLARRAYLQAHTLAAGAEPGLAVSATYDPLGTFSNACHVAVVEVDSETGRVSLLRFVVVEDAGIIVNPMIADGQIHGGVVQGIASALFEELVYDDDGNLLTTSLMDYLPPTMAEIPAIEIEHLETTSDASITGAKGLGEGGAIGAPAAVINAVNDALGDLGVQVNTIPATPELVLASIQAARQKA